MKEIVDIDKENKQSRPSLKTTIKKVIYISQDK